MDDGLFASETQLNSMAIAEQDSLAQHEAIEHYADLSAMLSDTAMPFFSREDFSPEPHEVAIIAATQPAVAMVDPGSGSVVVQASDFMFFDATEVSTSSHAVDAGAIPMSNPGEAISSTSAVAAGLGGEGSAVVDIASSID